MAAPKQTDPQFKLRMTPEIKEQIEVSAKANNRSLNAEILARLEDSFTFPEVRKALRSELEYLEARAAHAESMLGEYRALAIEMEKNEQEKFDLHKQVMDDRHILYVLLDADGMPLSWQEIMTHLGEIGRAGNFDIQKIEAHIVDAASASNNEREDQWWELVQKYRKLRKG